MRYQIYFPFKLAEGREIKDLPAEGTFGPYQAKLEFNSPYYTLNVLGIETNEVAHEIFDRIVGAFYWMATDSGLSHETVRELQKSYEPTDPIQTAKNFTANYGLKRERIDVVIDGGNPAIFEQEKIALKITAQPISFRMGYAPKKIFDALGYGFELRSPTPELRTAIDIYSFAHFFSERAARFYATLVRY